MVRLCKHEFRKNKVFSLLAEACQIFKEHSVPYNCYFIVKAVYND
jgi:hypothetical protein